MAARRRPDPQAGALALARWAADPAGCARADLAAAVRHTLAAFAAAHPGHAVEIRVPPFGAVQCLPGVRHRRGTPPNVVETDAATWLGLVTGRRRWTEAIEAAALSASGDRADLSHLLPLAAPDP